MGGKPVAPISFPREMKDPDPFGLPTETLCNGSPGLSGKITTPCPSLVGTKVCLPNLLRRLLKNTDACRLGS